MKLLGSVFLLAAGVSANVHSFFRSDSGSSEWEQKVVEKKNLRIRRIRTLSEVSASISMSLPDEVDFPFSMSMADIGEGADFEQFEALFSYSMSMSMPNEFDVFELEQFGSEFVASLSMSIPTTEQTEFEQFGAEFGASLSMSIPTTEQTEFEQYEEVAASMSMSIPVMDEAGFMQFEAQLVTSLSMSMPTADGEDFDMFEEDFGSSVSMSMPQMDEVELGQFQNNFSSLMSVNTDPLDEPKPISDDFWFVPIFDDHLDYVKDTETEALSLPISLSMVGDIQELSAEGDFDFFGMQSVSMSMSIPQ